VRDEQPRNCNFPNPTLQQRLAAIAEVRANRFPAIITQFQLVRQRIRNPVEQHAQNVADGISDDEASRDSFMDDIGDWNPDEPLIDESRRIAAEEFLDKLAYCPFLDIGTNGPAKNILNFNYCPMEFRKCEQFQNIFLSEVDYLPPACPNRGYSCSGLRQHLHQFQNQCVYHRITLEYLMALHPTL